MGATACRRPARRLRPRGEPQRHVQTGRSYPGGSKTLRPPTQNRSALHAQEKPFPNFSGVIVPRQRKPVELHVVDGTFRAPRHADRIGEARGRGSVGDPPAHLSTEVAEVWRELASSAPAGVLTGSDRPLLELAAVHLAAYRAAVAEAQRGPLVQNTVNGPKANVALVEARRQSAVLLKLLTDAGFTPTARTRIVVGDSPDLNGHGLTG